MPDKSKTLAELWTRSDSPLPHRYTWEDSEIRNLFAKPLYQRIIRAKAFTRLADIRFLGAIDYFVHPTGQQLDRRRHTRYEHSLGVAKLALEHAQVMGLSSDEEKLIVVAALLHDIGHAPLSHSAESAFKEIFDLDHHEAGKDIVLNRAPHNIGSGILAALKEEKIDPEMVLDLCAGKLNWFPHQYLFSHPINIDTLEAICRSETYLNPLPASPPPNFILDALVGASSDTQRLENFWQLKDQIYSLLIQGPIGVLADYLTYDYILTNRTAFSRDDAFLSERSLRRKHPALFLTLETARTNLNRTTLTDTEDSVSVDLKARRFCLENTAPVRAPERYRQNKELKRISLSSLKFLARRDLEALSQPNLF